MYVQYAKSGDVPFFQKVLTMTQTDRRFQPQHKWTEVEHLKKFTQMY